MKKVIAITAGVVVAAAGAWVGASWYTGKKIEADVESGITRFNQQLESNASSRGVSVKIDSYERGILTSHVRYALHFSKDVPIWNVLSAGAPLPFEARIEHGPFAPGALAAGHFLPLLGYVHTEMINSDRARPLFSGAQGAVPLTADMRVAYNGDVSLNWHISRQDGTYRHGDVKFAGASGTGAYAQATQTIKMHGDIGAFSVQSKDDVAPDALFRRAAFDGATVDTDSHIGKFGFLVGDSTLKLKHASIDGTGSTVGSLDDVVYRAKMSEDDTALSGEVGLDVGKLKVDDIDMGAAQLVFKFNRLDGVAVRDLSQQFDKREDDWLNERVDEDEHEGMEREDALIAAAEARGKSIARLIAGKPSFSIDPLSVLKMPNGEARLTFAIELTSPDALEHGFPTSAIKTADATWKVSRTVLREQIAQRLQRRGLTRPAAEAGAHAMVDAQLGTGTWLSKMMSDKLMKLDGDNLVGSFHYADQVLDFNGSKVPVEKLGEYLSELL